LDESRIETLARQHGIRQKRNDGGVSKTLTAYLRRADEGTLSRMLVEATILLAASRHNGANVLCDAAMVYKVDTDAIASNVKQESAAKARAKKEAKLVPKAKKAPKLHLCEGRVNMPPLFLRPKNETHQRYLSAAPPPCTPSQRSSIRHPLRVSPVPPAVYHLLGRDLRLPIRPRRKLSM
jgi:hypothetical protein